MKAHPAVPAQIVIKHLQVSKNRLQDAAKASENVRRGKRVLHEESMRLRAILRGREEDLAVLERNLMAVDFVLTEIENQNESLIQIEQALQNELNLWLLRKEPLVKVAAPSPREIHYERSVAHEVPTPARQVQGEEVPNAPVDPRKAVGFYTMADGTRVFVNADNVPVSYSTPQPDGSWLHTDPDKRIVEPPAAPEIEKMPVADETQAYTSLSPESPTISNEGGPTISGPNGAT